MKISFNPFPILETERLVLRRLNLEDADAIFALRSSDIVNEFLSRQKAASVADACDFISKIIKGIDSNELINWAVCFRNVPDLIGTIVLFNFSEKNNKAEIGYELLPEYQGKGLMQEAVAKVISYGFETIKLHLIEAVLNSNNARSVKLLERNNFLLTSNIREEDGSNKAGDLLVYSLINPASGVILKHVPPP